MEKARRAALKSKRSKRPDQPDSTFSNTENSTFSNTENSTFSDIENPDSATLKIEPSVTLKNLPIDKSITDLEKEERGKSPLPESLISVLIEAYAETITSQADDVVLQKQAVMLEGKSVSVETLREFLAETELRPARFVAQNLLVWQAARTRQREKQLAKSLVGASPEERQRRLALVRGQVSASIAAQPEPEPDVALPEPGRTLWDDVLDVLERSISPEAFSTWFRPTRFVEQDGATIRVQIPDAVFEDWILNNYADELEAAIVQAEVEDCDLEFVVAARKAA